MTSTGYNQEAILANGSYSGSALLLPHQLSAQKYHTYVAKMVEDAPAKQPLNKAEWFYAVEYRFLQYNYKRQPQANQAKYAHYAKQRLALHYELHVSRTPMTEELWHTIVNLPTLKIPIPAMLDDVNRADPPAENLPPIP